MGIITLSCEKCTVSFKAQRKTRRFCSKRCADSARYIPAPKKDITGERRKCAYKTCTSTVWNYPQDIKQGRKRFCSKQCSNASKMTNTERICVICESTYYCSLSQVQYRSRVTCSRRCMAIKRTRDAERRNRENPPSQGVLNRRIRYSKKMQDWRIAVFERDNYTCQKCGKRGGYLQADHIKPFAYFPELRTVLSNGRTLCKPCHLETDTYAKKLTKEEIATLGLPS